MWLALGTGFFGMKRVLGPLAGAQTGKEGVTVRYAKDQVKDSPDIDADTISSEQERQLYSYYAIPHGTSESGVVLPEGDRDYDRQVDLEAADRRAVTRHEEELRVGTARSTPVGCASARGSRPSRSRCTRRRQVVREPVDGAVTEGTIGEDAIEVTLSEEQPVVEKRTVAKERVGVERTVETEHQTIADDVRRNASTTRPNRERRCGGGAVPPPQPRAHRRHARGENVSVLDVAVPPSS